MVWSPTLLLMVAKFVLPIAPPYMETEPGAPMKLKDCPPLPELLMLA